MYTFARNQDEPLEVDVVIVDESSMLNLELYYALIQAIPPSAYVVLVGDEDQLPPIGAGFILRDMLTSSVVPYQGLTQIYRQQEGNRIIDNAYAINHGEIPDLSSCDEFQFESAHDVESVLSVITKHYKELKVDGTVYRIGDKVIQMENNYDQDVYNGEIGVITDILGKQVHVKFPDKSMTLDEEDMMTMALAYAITVHKAQGSEYERIILPFISAYNVMLQRNLLYTAITRAKDKVILVGSETAVECLSSAVKQLSKRL